MNANSGISILCEGSQEGFIQAVQLEQRPQAVNFLKGCGFFVAQHLLERCNRFGPETIYELIGGQAASGYVRVG